MAFSSDNSIVTNQLPISIDFPRDPELFLDQLTLLYKRIADAVNRKEGSVYPLNETSTFKQYPIANNPQKYNSVLRKVFDLISLNGGVNIAAAATVSFPHGITGITQAAIIYVGCANTVPEYFSLMYPDVYLTATNIVFTNSSAAPVTHAIAVAEYLKS